MMSDKSENGVHLQCIANGEKTNFNRINESPSKTQNEDTFSKKKNMKSLLRNIPSPKEIKQYAGILICGVTLWATSWFILKDAVLPGGFVFGMIGAVIAGYVFGHTMDRYMKVNPVVGMTLVGLLYRNFGPQNFLNHPTADTIDFHLRRVYAVIILTKGALSWNWEYIKHNSVKVFSLATLPWIVECLSNTVFFHIWFGFPWYWGLHLGAILSSVSPAIVVPITLSLRAQGIGEKRQIAHLVGNAGGLDTAFTEGMYGVLSTALFCASSTYYKILKAFLAVFVGIALGVFWGVLADQFPEQTDAYASIVRSLHLLAGGLLISYTGPYFNWGGTAGVAVMVAAGTAASRWARHGWIVNDNPVTEIYKLLWRIFEPMLFTLSGYFFEISKLTIKEFGLILCCISLALLLRMLTAFLVSLANSFSVKESIFIAVTWIPKAIVEAVLVRAATDILWEDASTEDKRAASQHANIIVIAILITTTIGSTATSVLGPVLLSDESRIVPEGQCEVQNSQELKATTSNLETKCELNISSGSLQVVHI